MLPWTTGEAELLACGLPQLSRSLCLWFLCVSEETMEQALIADRIFSEFFQNLKSQIRAASIHAPQRWDAKEKELRNTLMDIENDVHKAFCDDLNTPAVLHSLRRLVTAVNKYVADTTTPPVRLLLKAVGDFVTRIFKTLGLIDPTPSIGFSLDANQVCDRHLGSPSHCVRIGASGVPQGSLEEEIAPFLDALTQFREKGNCPSWRPSLWPH